MNILILLMRSSRQVKRVFYDGCKMTQETLMVVCSLQKRSSKKKKITALTR